MGHKLKKHKTLNNRTEDKTTFFYHTFRNLVLCSAPLLLISVLVLSLPHSSASQNNSSDKVSLSVPVSCNLTASIASGKEHTISMVSGTYEDEIGETVLKTSCNDANGYIIYAIGNTDNIEGKNVLSGIVGSAYDIPTGTATSGDTSQWAMKLSSIASATTADTPIIAAGYNSYHTVPNTWTKVASKSSGTMNMTTGSNLSTTYAIYLKGTQPAGTYSGQVKYVMLHPSTAAEPTDTLEHAFALAGKQKISVTDPITGQSGSFYKMQDMETSICESTTLVDEQNTLQLVDIRDNKLYWVTKLQDGHCWMTQNLDLDLAHQVALTSLDTDLNDNSLMGAYSEGYSYDANTKVISWIPGNDTIDFTTTVTGWQSSYTIPYSASKTDDTNTGHASLGNYYNWTAAIASNNSSSLYNNNNNAHNSICPTSWRLPNISDSEFSVINNLYNSGSSTSDIGLIAAPLYFIKPGYINFGNLYNLSEYGHYWSSTVNGGISSYYLSIENTSVNPAQGYDGQYASTTRDNGKSIRCLAR